MAFGQTTKILSGRSARKDLQGVVAVSLIGLLSFFGVSPAFAQAKKIIIDGSSTVFPIAEAVAEEFMKVDKVQVSVSKSGTGGGFKKFCRGETDVQNASRPITSIEMKDCKEKGISYFELPVAFDAIVIIVNPKNDWLKSITISDLKKMWDPESQKNKITNWNQINKKWPNKKFSLYGAGSDSGTFDYFTEAVVGKARASRTDYSPNEDDNIIVTGVANDKYALGFVPLSYYEENMTRVKALSIITEKGPKDGVMPTMETVKTGAYTPLSRPIFIYVKEQAYKRAEVKNFTQFFLTKGADLVAAVKYIPLPKTAYEMAKDLLSKNRVGTVFEGHSEVGMKIEDLLKKEARL